MSEEKEKLNVNDLGNGKDIEEIREMLKKIQRLHNKVYQEEGECATEMFLGQIVHDLRWVVDAQSHLSVEGIAIQKLKEMELVEMPEEDEWGNGEFITHSFWKEVEE